MKREIKFKAYDTRLKLWCYEGIGFTIFGEILMIDGFSSHFIENPVKDEQGKYLTSLERINDIMLFQFTGQKDKYNNEIYEGDIVEMETYPSWGFNNAKGEVKYEGSMFTVENWNLNGWPQEKRTIVGNIFK